MKFSKQNIPESQKTKEWHNGCLDDILKYNKSSSSYAAEKTKDYENYLLVTGQFDKKQFKYVTDMYGITAPARFVNYPIIMPKIDLLAGEIVSQPLKWSVNVVNRNAIRRKNEKKIQMAAEVILKPIRREIEKALGTELKDEEIGEEVPEDVEQFQNKRFRDIVEEQVHVGLNFISQKQKLKSVFKRGFYDLTITGKEFYRVTVKNRDPYIERIDPRSVIYDFDSDKENLQDSKFAGLDNWYTVNEIVDRFQLSGSVVDELEKLEKMDSNSINELNSGYDCYMSSNSTNLKVRVVDVEWKSFKTMKYKVTPNKYDKSIDFYKMVKDDYKGKDGEKVVTKVISDVRYAIRAGHEILLAWGRKPNIVRHEDNYANCKLGFFGIIKNSFNSQTLSVVDSLKNIQILYNLVMYQVDLAMARSGGKALVYDVSQKPKNVPLEDVMYHAKNSGLVIINSRSEGMQGSSFNQFQQIDLTLSQSIGQLINLKVMLEQTADQLTGITASRSGISKSSDAVGVNERSVMQSTLITAPLFDLHYDIIGDVMNEAANLFRYCWSEENRMINVFGDMGFETFKWDKSSALDEYGIFVENSSKELQRKQSMFSLMDRMASTGSLDPISSIKAMNAESASEVESILVKGMKTMQEMQQQQSQQQSEIAQQANEINQQKINVPIEVAKIKAEADIRTTAMKLEGEENINSFNSERAEDMQSVESQSKLDQQMLADSNKETQMMNDQSEQLNEESNEVNQ
jgi:hypothetical protein